MNTKFLFMDEKYPDQGAPRNAQATSLTGVLIPATLHQTFRAQFYGLVAEAIGDPENVISKWPHKMTHASELLPDLPDDKHFRFLEGLVTLVNRLELRIYRFGYCYGGIPQAVCALGGDIVLIGDCFLRILWALKDEGSQVWPVMETDRSNKQDQVFAGTVQISDYAHSRFGSEGWWVSEANFGEVLYMTKRSGYGALVDCVASLLHIKWLRSISHPQTKYKERLASIASGLNPAIALDKIAPMKVHASQ